MRWLPLSGFFENPLLCSPKLSERTHRRPRLTSQTRWRRTLQHPVKAGGAIAARYDTLPAVLRAQCCGPAQVSRLCSLLPACDVQSGGRESRPRNPTCSTTSWSRVHRWPRPWAALSRCSQTLQSSISVSTCVQHLKSGRTLQMLVLISDSTCRPGRRETSSERCCKPTAAERRAGTCWPTRTASGGETSPSLWWAPKDRLQGSPASWEP